MAENLLPINQIYSIVTNKSHNWGIDGYQVSKTYQDHIKLKEERTGSVQPKPSQKSANKGHYLDLITKQSTGPGPKYDTSQSMVLKCTGNMTKPSQRKTYIDDILSNGKKYNFPSSSTYKIQGGFEKGFIEAEKYGKVNRKHGDRQNFVNSYEHSSAATPGPGEYNPHQVITPLKENHFSPKQIRDVDEQKLKKYQSTKTLGPSYDPIIHHTFAERTQLPKYFAQNNSRVQNEKKHVTKKDKGDRKQPGPGQYNVLNEWRGKGDVKKRNLLDSLSFGRSQNVYH